MQPIPFKEANSSYPKPEGAADNIVDLPVWEGSVIQPDGSAIASMVSCWKPSAEDIEAFQKGEPIYMQVMQSGPSFTVALHVGNPFIPA